MTRWVRAILIALLSAFVGLHTYARAQEKSKTTDSDKTEKAPEITPVRVQVVFSEYEGEKKVSSLPYTLLVNADEKGPTAALRMGLRVPVPVGAGDQTQYMDVGTNLDGRAWKTPDGRFTLGLGVEKSSIYWSGADQKPGSAVGIEASTARPSNQPVVQQFRAQVNLLIRDGQTIQSTVATDPVTGRTLKIDVTLNVVK